MKKRIISIVMILVLCLFSVYSFETKYEDNTVGMKFEKEGWYLVPYFADISCDAGLKLCKDDVLIEFTYVPMTGKYYSSVELDEENKDIVEVLRDILTDNSVIPMYAKWIYVKQSGVNKWVFYETKEDKPYYRFNPILRDDIEKIELFSGWNFVSIAPSMVYDKGILSIVEVQDLIGTCDVDEIYMYDPDYVHRWVEMRFTSKISIKDIGYTMLIKSNNNCNLGYEEVPLGPPSVPK